MYKEYYGFVYLTTSKINGKRYIGQRYYDTKEQWKLYLGSGKILKDAIKKYGRNNFTVEILENCKTKEILNNSEKYWIKKYNAISNDSFYNIAMGGDGGNVIAGYSEERRNELKALHSKRSKEYIPSCDKSYVSKLSKEQFDDIFKMLLDGEYDIEIGKKHNINHSTISDIRNHKTWCDYTNGIEFPKQIKRYGTFGKKVVQYNLDGEIVSIYASARECERAIKIGYKLISAVCNGSKPTAHGFVFRFEGDSFDKYELNKHIVKIYKLSMDFDILDKFNSIKEAESTVGNIRLDQVVKGKSKISCGFRWYREDELHKLVFN